MGREKRGRKKGGITGDREEARKMNEEAIKERKKGIRKRRRKADEKKGWEAMRDQKK